MRMFRKSRGSEMGGGANDVHQRTLQTENAEKPYGGAGIFNVRNAYVFSPFLSHGIEDGGR